MSEDRARLAAGVRLALIRINRDIYSTAAAIGCSVTSLYRWRSGASAPNEASLAALARASGLTQDEIRNGGSE